MSGAGAADGRSRAMYTPAVERAVILMLQAHGLKRGKAGKGFQASHVLSVAMIVHAHGFDESTVIAAVLHDTLEDTDLDPRVIADGFGDHIAAVVSDVTEPSKEMPWPARKAVYIEQLRRSPRDEARAVASADKIHNLSRMIDGLASEGERFWERFNATKEEIVEYQTRVFEAIRERWQHPILARHQEVLARFLDAAGRQG
jgi:(p)ppGpp synthase/HD superfamily hydrolase